jgi:hypothetical protein
MRLDVRLPENQQVALFMDTRDHYVLGFRGRDKIYLLRDTRIDEFEKQLVAAGLVASGEIERLDVGSDHNSLGTLKRSFSMAELLAAGKLADYSSRDGRLTHEHVKGPISLLVCLVAECSRVFSMQWICAGIYYHRRIQADEAIQSWQDAVELVRLSQKYFPLYARPLAIEKLEKRATEMNDLVGELEAAAGGTSNRKALIQRIVDGQRGSFSGHAAMCADRLRQMARELGIREASDLTTILTACKNKVAVRAAKEGVAIPGSDLPF